MVSTRRSSGALCGRYPAMDEGGLEVEGRLGAGSNSNGFFLMWEHLKEKLYAVPARTVENVARLQAAVQRSIRAY